MISLDDAGWGSLIGGVLIGVYREKTQEFRFEEVQVKYFQGAAFSNKEYLDAAGLIATGLLANLKVTKQEPIKICTGYCLDGIAEVLSQEGFNSTRDKIIGPLQEKIESALRTVLECKYGFKVSYEELTDPSKKGLFWYKQIQWLKDGNVNRQDCNPTKKSLCKTGWATFNAWANLPYQEAKVKAKQIKAMIKRERKLSDYYNY